MPTSLKFRGYAGLYRDSQNTNTPAYTFLCLYRILEGLIKDRAQRGKEARAKGEASPSYRTWLVPSLESQYVPWMKALYPVKNDWLAGQLDSTSASFPRGARIF